MKKVIPMMVLAMMIAVQPANAQLMDKKPFCSTCEIKKIPADVYIVIVDDVENQMISGQFFRIKDQEKKMKNLLNCFKNLLYGI